MRLSRNDGREERTLSMRTLMLFAAAGLLMAQAAAIATPLIPSELPALGLKINDHGQGPPEWVSPYGIEIARNKFQYRGNRGNARWDIDWDIEADPDPFLNATFTITNHLPTAQNFTLNAVLPISPQITVGTLTGGSFSGTLMDTGQGATLDAINGASPPPMYMARIDGVDFQALDLPSLPVTAIPFGTAILGPMHFGTPIPSLPGPTNVLTDIEIETNIRVSGGDIAIVVATFVVEPVPEPGTLAVLALGGLALVYRRRRK